MPLTEDTLPLQNYDRQNADAIAAKLTGLASASCGWSAPTRERENRARCMDRIAEAVGGGSRGPVTTIRRRDESRRRSPPPTPGPLGRPRYERAHRSRAEVIRAAKPRRSALGGYQPGRKGRALAAADDLGPNVRRRSPASASVGQLLVIAPAAVLILTTILGVISVRQLGASAEMAKQQAAETAAVEVLRDSNSRQFEGDRFQHLALVLFDPEGVRRQPGRGRRRHEGVGRRFRGVRHPPRAPPRCARRQTKQGELVQRIPSERERALGMVRVGAPVPARGREDHRRRRGS